MKQKHKKFNFSEEYKSRLVGAYKAFIAGRDPELAELIKQKDEIDLLPTFEERSQKYADLWDDLDENRQADFMEAMAKIGFLSRSARKIAVAKILDAHDKKGEKTADKFDYTLEKFKDGKLSTEVVQEIVDKNAVSWFSITAHPTNPTSLEFTKANAEIDALLENKDTTKEELTAALGLFHDAKIAAPKKTVAEEVDEAILPLDAIYDSVPKLKRKLRDALDKHGYGDVEIKNALVRPNIWAAGDGDGNDNTTAEALSGAITKLKTKIKDKYISDLDKAIAKAHAASCDTEPLEDLKAGLTKGRYKTSDEFRDAIGKASENYGGHPSVTRKLSDLSDKVEVFGFEYAKIDIRHNSNDIMQTLGRLLQVTGEIENEKDFYPDDVAGRKEKRSYQAEFITRKLQDEEFIKKVIELDTSALGDDATGKMAANMIERLRIIGKNPEMSEKFIVAETSTAANCTAALLLLKATGSEVANERAKMNVVPLFEYREDLEKAPAIVDMLLKTPVFAEHVKVLGQMITMIAKSDTVRKSGTGVQGEQERTVGKLHELMVRYPDITIFVMHGFGLAMQRGGGRITEVPAVVCKAIRREGGSDMGPTLCTIQGHQGLLVFSPESVGLYYMEGIISQNLLAVSKIKGEIEETRTVKEKIEQKARGDTATYFGSAVEAFEKDYFENPSLVGLAANFPMAIANMGNVSSRKGARNAASSVANTPEAIIGKNKNPFSWRAIGLDRLMAHSGTYFTAILGVKEGLENILSSDKSEQAMNNTYRGNKSFRDAMRTQAVIMHMVDFDIAWRYLGQARPDSSKIEELAAQFQNGRDVENSPEVTMAFLEKYTYDSAKLVYKAITGEEPKEGFTLKDPLRSNWPELSDQMLSREKQYEFARVIEADTTKKLMANPDSPLSDSDMRLLQNIYAACDFVNTPSGIGLTQTDIRKDPATGKIIDAQPLVFSGKGVEKILKQSLPDCLKGGVSRAV